MLHKKNHNLPANSSLLFFYYTYSKVLKLICVIRPQYLGTKKIVQPYYCFNLFLMKYTLM